MLQLDEVVDEASFVGSGLAIEDDDGDDQVMHGILAPVLMLLGGVAVIAAVRPVYEVSISTSAAARGSGAEHKKTGDWPSFFVMLLLL